MREKLRGFFTREGDAVTSKDGQKGIVARFTKEMKDLLEGNETPKPIEYYTHILVGAFEFIEKNPQEKETLMQEYITFQ